jgi:hypothetical protein
MEYTYIPNVFFDILCTSLTLICTAYANPHVHACTQTIHGDLISLHLILLRNERLEMRSVYLHWYGLLATNDNP